MCLTFIWLTDPEMLIESGKTVGVKEEVWCLMGACQSFIRDIEKQKDGVFYKVQITKWM